MKEFIFLYPISEIIDFEIKNHGWMEKGGIEIFRQKYKTILNQCINFRYRQKDFGINYAIFNGSSVSNVIELQKTDKTIEVGLDFKTHTTKQVDGKYLYPDSDYIINQLSGARIIRIAGFHMWDCVERLARRAYEKGLDILVDEDLTEFFTRRLKDPDFKVDQYPNYNARQKPFFEAFMEARKGKPWLWQNY